MTIDIRLLGTVELRVDGQLVTMGAAKRRAVLAGLALEANRPVSLDRLSQMVWAGPTPASAVANLRSHVAGLRRAVGDRIVAHPGGYELRLAGVSWTSPSSCGWRGTPGRDGTAPTRWR